MKSLFFVSFFLSFSVGAKCQFDKKSTSKIYSLSGPVTVALKEMGLLSEVTGVSIFHPLSERDFKGQILPGGVFLASQTFQDFSGSLIFYDESRELRKNLSSRSSTRSVEVVSRNLTPHEVTLKVVKLIEPFLVGCEKELSAFSFKSLHAQNELLNLVPSDMKVVFFLGELRPQRKPELIISHDGVVKFLKENKRIVTYPSILAYANWSMKIVKALPSGTVHVGVKDSAREMSESVVKFSPTEESVTYPGALVPGLSQLQAWIFWLKNRSVQK